MMGLAGLAASEYLWMLENIQAEGTHVGSTTLGKGAGNRSLRA